jgi:benzoyl-CoA 2,3-dioxygenase component B
MSQSIPSSKIDYSERIPNNVNLSDDRRLQRALEQWQPNFLSWWMEMGPEGFQQDQIYLRTAVSVEKGGWAHFDYVRMPDYRWGIFLTPNEDRTIGFGQHLGEPSWDQVPGEYRNSLKRLIVTQGDTEPASIEQQRLLGKTCPSLYDLRNLFQVNVEEGRHLWAMVYLLQRYFGRDGREEAEAMLERRSGHPDKPRILSTFNEPIDDWLSFFCFTMFTDRDGKYQLASLAESGFDALARTTQFMLTEEAHHLFVGETGVERVIRRSAELMAQGLDPRQHGAIPIEIVQRYINKWFANSLDLFGAEVSSNAADFFATSLKGRYHESRYDDHQALDQSLSILRSTPAGLSSEDVPLRNALNEVLRLDYIKDCQRALNSWNKTLNDLGLPSVYLPSNRFFRVVGEYAKLHFNPAGDLIDEQTWLTHQHEWLPTPADLAYVKSLMQPVITPGDFAPWIAPPKRGINGMPVEFEYVKFNRDLIA